MIARLPGMHPGSKVKWPPQRRWQVPGGQRGPGVALLPQLRTKTSVASLPSQVPGALRLRGDQRGADIAMVVLGGVAGLVLAMHYVMLFWDNAELAFVRERGRGVPGAHHV